MADRIEAALTPEEWGRIWYVQRENLELDGTPPFCIDQFGSGVTIHNPKTLHTLAALCLYGQPFGFTQEDLAYLTAAIADQRVIGERSSGLHRANAPRMLAGLESLASRIAALLPPTSSTETTRDE